MRVAFDATPLLEVRTGVGALVEELLVRLSRAPGIDVVAFGYTRIYLEELRARLPPGVVATRRAIPSRLTRALWRRTDHPVLERWTGPIDLVHAANFVVPPARAAALVTVHDLTFLRYPELCDDNTRRYPGLIHRAIRRGAHVHCPSEYVAQEVQSCFSIPADRVHVVHNGVSAARHGSAAGGRALADADRYVLALGTIEPRKNLPLLVEAFDRLAGEDGGLHLVVAGREGWGAENYRRALARARHAARIRTLGFVTEADRADLLAGATVLAYPSRYEGFGLPPLEAMTVGVPVVATAVGALPEVVADGALLVAPDDVNALAAGLDEVLQDPATRQRLVAAGGRRANLYSWDRCAREMIEVYRRVSAASAG